MKLTAGRPRLNLTAQVVITKLSVAAIIGLALFQPSPLSAQSSTSIPSETPVVTKRAHGHVISIVTADGRLHGGKNNFCAVFQKLEGKEPTEIQNVKVDFALQVGRIQERPIRVQLAPDRMGHYCGQVDLGKQFYVPAFYYAFVQYTATAGKRKERLFFSIR